MNCGISMVFILKDEESIYKCAVYTGFMKLERMNNTTDFRIRWDTKAKSATSQKEGNLSSPRPAATIA